MKLTNFLKKYFNLEILSDIVWSNPEINEKYDKIKNEIKFAKLSYACLIVFVCSISFASLFNLNSLGSFGKSLVFIGQILSFFVFCFDYCAHLITYRFKVTSPLKIKYSLLFFPISFIGILLLLCVFSSVHALSLIGVNMDGKGFFGVLKGLNILKIFRIFLVFKLIAPFRIIINVFEKQRKLLTYIFLFIIILIILFGLIIWNNELEYVNQLRENFLDDNVKSQNNTIFIFANKEFANKEAAIEAAKNSADYQAIGAGYIDNFIDAIYFSTITLTTIGYGDFSPHAPISKALVSVMALLGLAIIAIPSGIIAGSFLTDIQSHLQNKKPSKLFGRKNKEEPKEENKEIQIKEKEEQKND
ncbi:potassium channel family protein [Mycoplasmopsis gallinacea]|uniref:Voltage-gated potassium channel n=1 Tax=Mycoplasmopsis gallinacea TaxID=29556 RepID=A0A449A3R0_9BACT|nr:potassium channel family protein [Mycoplasmopsis gallinacea]VEU58813.1 voltage-gated potassium channel [Mycoplasmopsis gallinacea]